VTWQIGAQALAVIVAHAREAFPLECCGVLVGTVGRIVQAVRARNIATGPNRFHIDPKDHVDARRQSRREGLDIIGFYHSHPAGAAAPSETDRAEATYDRCLHVIVAVAGGVPDVRAFWFERGEFSEVDFTCTT
jgi:proteasome lid subunit RPN8/RPN11